MDMAKRFIQHELLRNPWLRAASTLEKLLWVGLITECDHAGIWIVDWQMMELMVGGKIDPGAAKKFLNGRFLEVDICVGFLIGGDPGGVDGLFSLAL